jgi:hypothetical protein
VCLENKTNATAIKAVYGAIFMSMSIYFVVSLVAIYMFGSMISSNVLDNVGNEGATWEALVLRIAFLLVIGCHIPYVFYGGKECLLIMIDEFTRQTVSKSLDNKLASSNEGTPRESA